MKFHLVPIGKQFDYQDEIYTKSGPIAASSEKDGRNRMIPRSANVQLLTNGVVESVPNDIPSNSFVLLSDVIHAVNDSRVNCLKLIAANLEKRNMDSIENTINSNYIELKDRLNNLNKGK